MKDKDTIARRILANFVLKTKQQKTLYLADWILQFPNECNEVIIKVCVEQFDLKSYLWIKISRV